METKDKEWILKWSNYVVYKTRNRRRADIETGLRLGVGRYICTAVRDRIINAYARG